VIIEKNERSRKSDYKIAAYTAAGIIGAIALASFIISGGLLPNSSVEQTITPGSEPGVIHGYVSEPAGLPAIGSTVVAFQQGDDFFASSFVSVNGQFYPDVPHGNYIVVAAYPDGTDRIATLDVDRGSARELNFG
jgi:hypothetical protein